MFIEFTKAVTNPALDSPTLRPLTVAEAKAHCRVDSDDDDALIERLIDAAVASVEGPAGIGAGIMERQWRLTLDVFPETIWLEIGPVLSVDAISYIDTAGATQTLTVTTDYRADLDHDPARVVAAYGTAWPATRPVIGAVTVLYSAGYETPQQVPADLRSALLMVVAHLYENREAVVIGQTAVEIPLGAQAVFERYRVGRFG